MAQNFNFPSADTPFLVKDTGLVSLPWYTFLVAIFQNSSSGVAGNANQTLHGAGVGYASVSLTADVTGRLAFTNVIRGTAGAMLLAQGAATDSAYKAMSGDATMVSSGAVTVALNVVTNAKLAQMAANSLKGNNTGAPANAADLTVSQVVTMLQGAFSSMQFFNGATVTNSATYYGGGPCDWQTADTNRAQSPVPIACNVKNLYAVGSSAPGGTDTFTLTLQKNGADTALATTITGAAVTSANVTNTVTMAAGDTMQMKLVTSATAAASDVRCSVLVES